MALALPLWCRSTVLSLKSDSLAPSGRPWTSISPISTFCYGRSGAGEHYGCYLATPRRLQSRQFKVAVSVKQGRFRTICAAAASDRNAGARESVSNLTITDAQIITAPPGEDNKLRVRVDISGETSKRAFDTVLKDLARNAPPVPGFRKAKGGKTSIVPLNVAYQFIGPKLVRKFVIDEIIKATLEDYLKKESIKVKSDLKTEQSREELTELFEPGKAFGFDATLDLESSENKEDEPVDDQDAARNPQTVEASA